MELGWYSTEVFQRPVTGSSPNALFLLLSKSFLRRLAVNLQCYGLSGEGREALKCYGLSGDGGEALRCPGGCVEMKRPIKGMYRQMTKSSRKIMVRLSASRKRKRKLDCFGCVLHI